MGKHVGSSHTATQLEWGFSSVSSSDCQDGIPTKVLAATFPVSSSVEGRHPSDGIGLA